MATETNLNVAPYFDDFDEKKNFHRILFKPINGVQVRELNQLQSILQNQIERFGNSIYKDGAILSGCGVTVHDQLHFIRLSDRVANGELLNVTTLVGKTVESPSTGLQAKILTVKTGTEQNFPYTNRLYVRYMNSGNNDGVQVQTFGADEALNVYENPRSSNNLLVSCSSFANTGIQLGSAGVGHGATVADGLIYQKGFFVRSEEQTVVVSDSINAGNAVVGFITNESIVTADQDDTLYDNALGYANPSAPGADRLKLTANLAVIYADDLTTTQNFTSIIQYIGGIPVMQNGDDRYSAIGDEMSRRMEETSGSFVIKPFKIDTTSANATHLIAQVSPGSGYAQGHRVELLKTAPVSVRRGTDFVVSEDQIITTNYGNYILVNEMTGVFDFDKLQEVEIYDTVQQAVTKKTFSSTGTSGTLIGRANLRAIKYNVENSNGPNGTPGAVYEFYLFNIRMVGNANFGTSARSIRQVGGGATGFADLMFINGQNLFNAERRGMIWKFGQNAVKNLKDASDNINTQYMIRARSSSTLGTDGIVSLTLTTSHAGGLNGFPYGNGVIGSNEYQFSIVTHAATQSANLGNVTVNSSTVTGTNFNTRFSVGEYILLGGSEVRRLTAVSATSMTLDTASTAAAGASVTFAKYFPAGYTFPLVDSMVGTRTATVTSPTSITFNVGTSVVGALTTNVPVSIYHNILRSNAVPAKKSILKNLYIKLDTQTHANTNKGPWSLGLVDVHQIRKITVDGTTYNVNGSDLSSIFYFDTGGRDTHYDLATLYLRPGQSIPANSKILVTLDAFQLNTSPGVGFLSVDSYPIDDMNTANTNAITSAELPVYISETGVRYPLRDCIDFRPAKTNTASLSNNLSLTTVNPAAVSNTFNLDTVGTYVPSPDENFQTDIAYYVGRKDSIYLSNRGFIKIKPGTPAKNPQTPTNPDDGMVIAVLNIPPFPSLSSTEVANVSAANRSVFSAIRDTSYSCGVSIVANKRYRMPDIGNIDKRVARLEYYQALNLLEAATTSLQVPDANGNDRFKNGIFVDPFTNFSLADVANPEFRIALDSAKGIVRPFYNEDRPELEFNLASSTAIVRNASLLTLPFDEIVYASQPFATNIRAASSVAFQWSGQLKLFPTYGHNIDKVAAPAVQVSLDLATPWQDFANSPFGMNYGDWRVTNTETSTVSNVTGTQEIGPAIYTTTESTTTTTTTNSRDGQKLNIDTKGTSYNLGNYVEDISIQPYIASAEIAFHAYGMRPNTKLYVYIDDVNVSSNAAPGVRNASVTDTSNSNYVTRTAAYGTDIRVGADGSVYGKILIPANKFRVGERQIKLTDVNRLEISSGAVTTIATASYTASNFSVTQGSTTLSTVNPIVSYGSLSDAYSTTTATTTTNITVNPNPNYREPEPVINNITNITNNITNVVQPEPKPPEPTPVYTPEQPPAPVTPPPQPPEPPPVEMIFIPNIGNVRADDWTEALRTHVPPYTYFDFLNMLIKQGPQRAQEAIAKQDPLSQCFRIELANGISGMYMNAIGVYFAQKSENTAVGCSVYICEILNGYPDGSKIIPHTITHLNWNQINVSDNGTVETKFTFESPVFLTNGKQYAYVILPDGGDPDYDVWTAVLGSNDIATGVQVSSKPYIDTAFMSSNQSAWTALQNEFVKFNLYQARFNTNKGTAVFNTTSTDYLNISGVVAANSSMNIQVGDVVYGANATNGVVQSIAGYVKNYYVANNYMQVELSTGGYNDVTKVQIHRLPGQLGTPSANTLVASANIAKVGDTVMNAIVPRFANIQPAGTSLAVRFRAANASYGLDSFDTAVVMDTETELFDYPRTIAGRSNEVKYAGGNRLFQMMVDFKTDTQNLSPAVDMVRSNFLSIQNLIDPTTADLSLEYGNNGPAINKYLSKVVTLANGQDSEDLQVYLTAYKPAKSLIKVYAKFLNGEDADSILNKSWTPLQIDDETVVSDYRNTQDYRELLFTLPGAIPTGAPATTAYKDDTNGLTYRSGTNTYTSYKAFQIKIVLLSDSTSLVPRLNDVRALALLI